MIRRALAFAAAALAGGLVGAAPAAAAPTGEPAPLGYATYGAPAQFCQPRDARINSISGIAFSAGAIWVQDDRVGETFKLDGSCRPVTRADLHVVGRMTDTEDLASTADGALWVADIGGNRAPRTTISVVRIPRSGPPVRYSLTYPDGPHDAETLLLSPDGKQLLVVTKVASGVSSVFAPDGPLRSDRRVPLKAAGTLRISSFEGRNQGDAAVLVTGGAVSPDGLHLVLRTYTEAWEWDAVDGDLTKALQGLPRKVTLPVTKQGEAITYTADGAAFLVAGEQLAPVFKIAIERPRYAPVAETAAEPAAEVGARHDRTVVAAVIIGGLAACVALFVGAIGYERRKSHARLKAASTLADRTRPLTSRRG